jgi:hypothetical protein
MLRLLHIRANLSTAVRVDNPFGFIPLDEIIVEAVLRRNLKIRGCLMFSLRRIKTLIPSLTTEDSKEAEHCVLERLRAHTLKTTLGDPPAGG